MESRCEVQRYKSVLAMRGNRMWGDLKERYAFLDVLYIRHRWNISASAEEGRIFYAWDFRTVWYVDAMTSSVVSDPIYRMGFDREWVSYDGVIDRRTASILVISCGSNDNSFDSNLSRKLFHPLFAQRYSRLLACSLKVFLKIVTTLCATFYHAHARGYARTRVRPRTGLSISRNAIGDDRYGFMAAIAWVSLRIVT